jgi:hypothetical protein
VVLAGRIVIVNLHLTLSSYFSQMFSHKCDVTGGKVVLSLTN